jgi:hypothetical protein
VDRKPDVALLVVSGTLSEPLLFLASPARSVAPTDFRLPRFRKPCFSPEHRVFSVILDFLRKLWFSPKFGIFSEIHCFLQKNHPSTDTGCGSVGVSALVRYSTAALWLPCFRTPLARSLAAVTTRFLLFRTPAPFSPTLPGSRPANQLPIRIAGTAHRRSPTGKPSVRGRRALVSANRLARTVPRARAPPTEGARAHPGSRLASLTVRRSVVLAPLEPRIWRNHQGRASGPFRAREGGFGG